MANDYINWHLGGLILRNATIDGSPIESLSDVKWLPNSQHTISFTFYNNGLAFHEFAWGIQFGENDDDTNICWFLGSRNETYAHSCANGKTRTFSDIKFTVSNHINADTAYLVMYYRVYSSSVYSYNTHIIEGLSYRYAICSPTITEFTVERENAESKNLYVTAKGTVQEDITGTLHNAVSFQYSIGNGEWNDATEAQESFFTIEELTSDEGIHGLLPMTATTLFELEFSEYASFRLRFYNEYETGSDVIRVVSVVFANVHLAGCKNGGVSFGGFSQSTENNPMFECHYPAIFYNGASGISTSGNYSFTETKIGKWVDDRDIYAILIPLGGKNGNTTVIDITSLNLDLPIKFYGCVYAQLDAVSGYMFFLPAINSTASYNVGVEFPNKKTLNIVSSNRTWSDGWIYLEYVKMEGRPLRHVTPSSYSASSTYSSYTTAKAFDNDPSTFWCCSGSDLNPYVDITLGGNYSDIYVDVYSHANSTSYLPALVYCDVTYSDETTATYSQEVEQDSSVTYKVIGHFHDKKAVASIRLRFDKPATNSRIEIAEIKIYGCSVV